MNAIQFAAHYLSPLGGAIILAIALEALIRTVTLSDTPQNAAQIAATYPTALASTALLVPVGWVLTDANPATSALFLATAAVHAVRARIAHDLRKPATPTTRGRA